MKFLYASIFLSVLAAAEGKLRAPIVGEGEGVVSKSAKTIVDNNNNNDNNRELSFDRYQTNEMQYYEASGKPPPGQMPHGPPPPGAGAIPISEMEYYYETNDYRNGPPPPGDNRVPPPPGAGGIPASEMEYYYETNDYRDGPPPPGADGGFRASGMEYYEASGKPPPGQMPHVPPPPGAGAIPISGMEYYYEPNDYRNGPPPPGAEEFRASGMEYYEPSDYEPSNAFEVAASSCANVPNIPSTCGNGIVDKGEECDTGNDTNNQKGNGDEYSYCDCRCKIKYEPTKCPTNYRDVRFFMETKTNTAGKVSVFITRKNLTPDAMGEGDTMYALPNAAVNNGELHSWERCMPALKCMIAEVYDLSAGMTTTADFEYKLISDGMVMLSRDRTNANTFYSSKVFGRNC